MQTVPQGATPAFLFPAGLASHIAELRRKHKAADAELREALAHPSTDALRITELKRRKLAIKNQLLLHGALVDGSVRHLRMVTS